MKLTPVGKIAVLVVVAGVAIGTFKMLNKDGSLLEKVMPNAATQSATTVGQVQLPSIGNSSPAVPISNLHMPEGAVANVNAPQMRMLVWAWNAQMGLMFANGGDKTAKGSLMADRNVNLSLARQDDGGKMQEALVAFATSLSKGNPQPTEGVHFVAIMGDGSATFLAAVNQNLARLGSQYKAKVIGSSGYSRGEDKFMGPAEWRDNPHAAMGGVCAGVLRDGDWNIAQKWLGDNGLKTNPDEKTYDPDALNWVGANDYIDAGEKYIAGYSEDRPVVRNGKKTGETKHITVQAAVTWTPGDVNIAKKKGGLVSIVSTKQYSAQMPQVIIGIDKWCKDNREEVENMLDGMLRGGDAVKSSPEALQKAGEVSTKVYGEQNADYWVRYYTGATEADATGIEMDLGGSSVNNLADDMILFGRAPGTANTFAATYKVFGDIVKAQYPSLVPSYPSVDEVLDTTYLDDVAKKSNFAANANSVTIMKPKAPVPGEKPKAISERNWDIKFETGRASFTASAQGVLPKLLNDLLIAGNTNVEIHGHTDAVGSPEANMRLSEARAFAVKKWLEAKAPKNFPEGRIRVFSHGQEQPIAENSSEAGRAKNRRVEIKLIAN